MSTEIISSMQLMKDWGQEAEGTVLVDSSAALGVVQRKGNRKLLHIKVGMLTINRKKEENGELAYSKVEGEDNTADLMTKGVPPKVLQRHVEHLGQDARSGRADIGLKVANPSLQTNCHVKVASREGWPDDMQRGLNI